MPDHLGQFHKTERLEKYVEFNQLTRHQLIVAHLTLIESVEMEQVRLSNAMNEGDNRTLSELVTFAIEDLEKA